MQQQLQQRHTAVGGTIEVQSIHSWSHNSSELQSEHRHLSSKYCFCVSKSTVHMFFKLPLDDQLCIYCNGHKQFLRTGDSQSVSQNRRHFDTLGPSCNKPSSARRVYGLIATQTQAVLNSCNKDIQHAQSKCNYVFVLVTERDDWFRAS